MDSQVRNSRPKIWIIIVIILFILSCCVLSLIAAGILFARSQGVTLRNLITDPIQQDPQIEISESIPQATEEEYVPQEQPIQGEASTQSINEDYILAITSSGIWRINENSQELTKISDDTIDAPTPYRKGLSPNKRYYSYITGDINPKLVILDLQEKIRVSESPLSSPNSQIKPEMTAADPGQSVLMAMQSAGSLAWAPDGIHLAFVAAMDNSNTDLYLLNTTDFSINRLTDESSNATYINWSPDGRFIEFVTIDNFGTGAGMGMDALWVYDMSQGIVKMLENSTSSGEEFISWIDNTSFYISSWSALCGSYNLRKVDALTGIQEVILASCFSHAAYDPVGQLGLVAVSDFFVGACQCGDVSEFGTYSFGKRLGMSEMGVTLKKFEPINAFSVELLDPGNLFAVYTEQGLTHLFDSTGFPIPIPNEVSGLKPFPSPTGDYWVWYPYYGDNTGLWLTDNQMNLFELSVSSLGNVVWSNGGDRVYFYELNQIFYADAPGFNPTLYLEIPDSQIYAIGK
jgi:hypothetical protein